MNRQPLLYLNNLCLFSRCGVVSVQELEQLRGDVVSVTGQQDIVANGVAEYHLEALVLVEGTQLRNNRISQLLIQFLLLLH